MLEFSKNSVGNVLGYTGETSLARGAWESCA